jgi:hypothetical protein
MKNYLDLEEFELRNLLDIIAPMIDPKVKNKWDKGELIYVLEMIDGSEDLLYITY